MKCPKCESIDDRVVDSRMSREGKTIRRRRQCLECGFRFTTYETVEEEQILVVKTDGTTEPFDQQKILTGMLKACEKRPVQRELIETIAAQIVLGLEKEYDQQIPTRVIGEKVMQQLQKLDAVAFVRFASVYRNFKNLNEFEEEIRHLREVNV